MAFDLPTIEQLKRALHVNETIETLKAEFAGILGIAGGAKRGRKPGPKVGKTKAVSTDASADAIHGKKGKRKKRVMSAEARAKIAEAQRRRWAAQKKAAK